LELSENADEMDYCQCLVILGLSVVCERSSIINRLHDAEPGRPAFSINNVNVLSVPHRPTIVIGDAFSWREDRRVAKMSDWAGEELHFEDQDRGLTLCVPSKK
jgi:hypothetical protein